MQLADLELAEVDIKKALEIDPDNRQVLYMRLPKGGMLVLVVTPF